MIRRNLTAAVCVVCLVLFAPNPPSEALVVPDLVQVQAPAVQAGVNQFITGPFLDGVTEGNIGYALTDPAGTTNFFRLTPSQGSIQHFTIGDPYTLGTILTDNGLIFPWKSRAIEEFTFEGQFVGANGPILNDPGLTRCEFFRSAEFEAGKLPVILSTNQLFLPTILRIDEGDPGLCHTTGYELNSDLTLQTMPTAQDRHPIYENIFNHTFTRSISPSDALPMDVLGNPFDESFGFVDPQISKSWFPFIEALGVAVDFYSNPYLARRSGGGTAVVWGADAPNFSAQLNATLSQGPFRSDLQPYYSPVAPDPDRILSVSGVTSDSGSARLLQIADRFALLAWRENGVDQWGTFKYALFGKVVSAYGEIGGDVNIHARHVQDGIGIYFALDDLVYPFSMADKKSSDQVIAVDPDGSFSQTGVLAGTYEIQLVIDGKPIGKSQIVKVSEYLPAVLELPAMLGFENDQTYVSPAHDVSVNLSNGNLVVQSADVENQNVGPFLGLVRIFNSLDPAAEINVLNKDRPDIDPIPQPFGRGWTHNYNLTILNADTNYWELNELSRVPDTTVILIDEDGTRHTFIQPWPIRKVVVGEREVIELIQPHGTGADPMRLLKTDRTQFELTRKDGTAYTFDIVKAQTRTARLTRIEDSNRNALNLDYDPEGRLVQVESLNTGRKLTMDYAEGPTQISRITDDQGRVVQYQYAPGQSDLVGVIKPAESPIEYVYAGNRLVEMGHGSNVVRMSYDPFNRIVSVAPPDGAQSFAYEPSNEVASTKTSVIDAKGILTSFTYNPWNNFDAAGQPIGGGRVEQLTDGHGGVTRLEWDAQGTIRRTIEANGRVVTQEFDSLKNLVRWHGGSEPMVLTYPTDRPDFDPLRSLPTSVSGNSPASTHLTYNAAGNLLTSQTGDVMTGSTRNVDGTASSISDPAAGVTDLEYIRGNVAKITSPIGTTDLTYETREALGRADHRTGPTGPTQFSYDDAGRPTTVQFLGVALGNDVADLTTVLTYDGDGRVTQAVHPNGQVLSIEYTAGGRPSASRRTLTGIGTVEYRSSYDERGLLVGLRRPDGVTTSMDYDNLNRLSAATLGSISPRRIAFGYDSVGNMTSKSDGVESKTMDYDLESRLTREVRSLPGISTLTTSLSYNSFGLASALSVSGASPTDPSLVQTMSYDELNRPLRISSQSGPHRFSQDFVYEAGTGRLLRLDQTGYETRLTYDEVGRAVGILTKNTVSGLEVDMRSEYNANGYLTKFGLMGGGPPMERRYNTQGWVLEEKRGDLVENYVYDKLGNLIEARDNLGGRISRIVNEEGWVLAETVNGRTTVFVHDSMGRPIRRVEPDGSMREFGYNEHGEVIQEKIVGVVLAAGGAPTDIVTENQFDQLGNLISTSRNGADTLTYRWSGPYLMGMTDREGRVWTYERDAFGNLTKTTADSTVVMTAEYDGFGNRLSSTDAAGRTTRYEFDIEGRPIEQTDPDGTITTKKYHGSGKLVEQTTRTPAGQVQTESWDWAGGELLTKMANPAGEILYERTAQGHLSGIRFSGDLTGQLSYTTDARDRVLRIEGLGGISLQYTYNTDGDVASVTDHSGRATTIEYDANKRETRRVLPNGEIVEKQYNAQGRLLKQTHTIGSTVFSRTWEHDDRGRVVGYTEDGKRFAYLYDRLDRLVRAVRPDGKKFDYTYDARGNLTGVTGPDETVVQTFDAADRLVRREVRTAKVRRNRGHGNNDDHDDEDNPGKGKGRHGSKADDDDDDDDDEEIKRGKLKIFVYLYDPNGRVVSIRQVDRKGRVVGGTETAFTWDARDRPARTTRGDVSVDYSYDPEGRLIRRVERQGGTLKEDRRYVWDVTSENVIAELDAAGNVLARYTSTRAQDDVIAKNNLQINQTAIYSDFAANLPTKTVRDDFGNVIETLETVEPYGALQTASAVDHTRFQGKMQDRVSGLYYWRNRWYDPQARRFMTKDPLPPDENDPTGMNAYAAFGGNPVSNLDPMGLENVAPIIWVDRESNYPQTSESRILYELTRDLTVGGDGDSFDRWTYERLRDLEGARREIERRFSYPDVYSREELRRTMARLDREIADLVAQYWAYRNSSEPTCSFLSYPPAITGTFKVSGPKSWLETWGQAIAGYNSLMFGWQCEPSRGGVYRRLRGLYASRLRPRGGYVRPASWFMLFARPWWMLKTPYGRGPAPGETPYLRPGSPPLSPEYRPPPSLKDLFRGSESEFWKWRMDRIEPPDFGPGGDPFLTPPPVIIYPYPDVI